MRFIIRSLSLAVLLSLLLPMLAEAQIIGRTTGRRKPDAPPGKASAAALDKDVEASVIGPMRLFFLPVPVVIPIGDRQHPPGGPFNPPAEVVAGGEFFPRGLVDEGSGLPGPILDDFHFAPTLVTRRQYQLYLLYLDVFEDHDHCHPYEPEGKDHRPEGWYDPLQCEDPDQPVTGIDWFDAYGFAAWCGARLVTDLEWERAGGTAPRAEWLGSWYSSDWFEAPEAIREQPRGPADGTVTDGRWTFYQSMTVREADRSRSWRNIYTRSPDLGFRLAWSTADSGRPGDVPPADPPTGPKPSGK